MSAVGFIHDLHDAGRVRVAPWGEIPDDVPTAVRMLDATARTDLPGRPPPLHAATATWAFGLMYRAAQALIYRDVDEPTVRAALRVACPAPPSPTVCYSADLCFRVLPDLVSLARGLADEDPLLEELLALAARWPLSSVGVKGLPEVEVTAFIGDASLRKVYADRIIGCGDVARLADLQARRAVREALGAFPELAPAIAGALHNEKEIS
jgi:hypothetical protein